MVNYALLILHSWREGRFEKFHRAEQPFVLLMKMIVIDMVARLLMMIMQEKMVIVKTTNKKKKMTIMFP